MGRSTERDGGALDHVRSRSCQLVLLEGNCSAFCGRVRMALKPVLCCALVLCSQEQVGREEAFRLGSVWVEVLLADSQLVQKGFDVH